MPSQLCNRCVIELQLLSFSTCIYSYGYFFSACVSYSVMHVFVYLLEQYDVTSVFRVLLLSRMIVTSFFSFYFSSGTLLHHYFFFFPQIRIPKINPYSVAFYFILFPNKLRKNNESFHSPLKYCSQKFQFCGGEWRIGSQKSGDLEKKVKNPWSSGENVGFWLQKLTVQIPTSVCCVLEQDTVCIASVDLAVK